MFFARLEHSDSTSQKLESFISNEWDVLSNQLWLESYLVLDDVCMPRLWHLGTFVFIPDHWRLSPPSPAVVDSTLDCLQ